MSETRLVRRDELLQGDKGGGFRGRQPNACFLDAAICAGLRPADVLVYVKKCAEESEAFEGYLRAKREPEGRASGRAEHSIFR